MAVSDESPASHIHRFPQTQYIDTLRWLPQLSPSLRHVIISTPSSLQTFSFSGLLLAPLSSLPLPSPLASLKTSPSSLIAASTISGDVIIASSRFSFDGSGGGLRVEAEMGRVHNGVSVIDLSLDGGECVCAGEDGRVSLVTLGEGVGSRRVFDSKGLVEYSAVKWASEREFVTGGLGFGLHWWDVRKPGGPVSQFKGDW